MLQTDYRLQYKLQIVSVYLMKTYLIKGRDILNTCHKTRVFSSVVGWMTASYWSVHWK